MGGFIMSKHIRNILFGWLFLPVLVVVSCQRSLLPDEERKTGADESSVVTLRLAGGGVDGDTKVIVTDYASQEAAVGRWAYFVFENGGSYRFVRRGALTSGTEVSFNLPVGQYRIWVVANYPVSGDRAFDFHSVSTLGDFNALTSYLGDNASGSLAMAGTTENAVFTVTKTVGSETLPATVHLERLVSKVTLVNIRRAFTDATRGSKSLVLKHVYLTNVYPFSRYSSDLLVSELATGAANWYNYCGWHRGDSMDADEAVDAIVGERNLDISLAQNVTVSFGRSMYFFPNPLPVADDTHDLTWTGARCTRLVLECVYDNDPSRGCYYSATLPKDDTFSPIVRNRPYSVSVTLKDVGSPDPEAVQTDVDVEFTCDVYSWGDTYDVGEVS